MLEFIYTGECHTDSNWAVHIDASRHCDVAIVAEKYIVPDLVGKSVRNLVKTLLRIRNDPEELSIMSRLFKSVASSDSPAYIRMARFWTKNFSFLVKDHGKEQLNQFIVANPDLPSISLPIRSNVMLKCHYSDKGMVTMVQSFGYLETSTSCRRI
jgi:hypothetical protein